MSGAPRAPTVFVNKTDYVRSEGSARTDSKSKVRRHERRQFSSTKHITSLFKDRSTPIPESKVRRHGRRQFSSTKKTYYSSLFGIGPHRFQSRKYGAMGADSSSTKLITFALSGSVHTGPVGEVVSSPSTRSDIEIRTTPLRQNWHKGGGD